MESVVCQVTLALVLFSTNWMTPVQSRCNISACSGPFPDITDAYALVEVESGDVRNIAEVESNLLEEKMLKAYNCEVNDDFLVFLNLTLLHTRSLRLEQKCSRPQLHHLGGEVSTFEEHLPRGSLCRRQSRQGFALNNDFCDPAFWVMRTCKVTVTSVRVPGEERRQLVY
jgi:hypothetical protein